jgi:hypothetical protein
VVAYIALMFSVIGGGGGYALAATTHHRTNHHRKTTIIACASRRTGELFLHHRGRCAKGRHKVRWSIRGPRGKAGAPGAAGAPAPSIFAIVNAEGAISGIQPPEKGMTVARSGVGIYTITITDPICSQGANAPVVTPTSRFANDQLLPSGAAPVAFLQDNLVSSAQFTVQIGYMAGGSFTPADLNFDVQDTCLPSGGSSARR